MSQADEGENNKGDDTKATGEATGNGPAGVRSGGASKPPPAGEDEVFAEPELAKAEPDPLEVAKAEAQKFREQLLRTAADFENFRKRSRREQEDAARKGKESTVKDLLPVFDNLERAIQSADGAPDAKSVADGLRMIVRQFTSTLEKMGIKRIVAVGSPFDPSLHEAIQHIESKEHAAGVVAAEVQPGYQLGDHLVRAAMVVVSKGSPESAAPEGDENAN